MTHDSPPSQKTIQRVAAVNKTMTELHKIMAKPKVNDALNTRNGPNTTATLPARLAIGDEVLVYREPGKWTGSYKVLETTDSDVTVDTVNGAVKFRVTMVNPFHRYPNASILKFFPDDSHKTIDEDELLPFEYPLAKKLLQA